MDKTYPLVIKNLYFNYSNTKTNAIIDSISFSVNNGQIVAIVGSSGVGKTTLIKMINGTIHPNDNKRIKGEIYIFGEEIKRLSKPQISKYMGTVFQDPDTQIIFSCVEDELAFGMENLCFPQKDMTKRIDDVLELLNIESLRYRNPNQLSGGEKQLVVIASILCLDVDIIILDEVLTQVDKKGKAKILKALEKLKNQGKTIIMIEHDYGNLFIADSVYRLEEGKLNLFNFNGDTNETIY